MQPCPAWPRLPERVAIEPREQAVADILATAKETQKLYALCAEKQAAEAAWISG
jgi:hypothetical protein